MRVVEGVVHVASLLAVADEVARAKEAKIVRTRCLRQASHRREIADAELSGLEQRKDEPYAAGVGEDAERLGEPLRDAVVARESCDHRGYLVCVDDLHLAPVERNDRRHRLLHRLEDITRLGYGVNIFVSVKTFMS